MKLGTDYIYLKRGWFWGFFGGDRLLILKDQKIQTQVFGYRVQSGKVKLYQSGLLLLKTGYQWNGASGPTIDTPATIEASAGHDGLTDLLIKKKLPKTELSNINSSLYVLLRKNKVNTLRSTSWLFAVETLGKFWMR